MTMEAGQQVPEVTNTPPPDPDAAKYEALRKELNIEPEGDEPAPQAEPQAQVEPEPPEPQHVPRVEHENVQKALREAREQAKAAEAREQAIIKLIQETRAQRQQPQPEKAEAPKIPDVNEDPIGHFKALYEELKAEVQQSKQGSQQTAEHLQAQAQHQQLLQIVQHSEQAILDAKNPEAKPDYWEACAYLEGQRERELQRMYPDNAPFAHQYAQQQGFRSAAELRQAVLNHDRWAVAVQALQMGVSPAEFYYSLAQDRGYAPKAKDVTPNGVDKAKLQIAAAKKGRAASVSISGGNSGRKGADDMSITDLSDLAIEDPEMFDQVWEKMRKAGKLG